jgi:hypothetical protein
MKDVKKAVILDEMMKKSSKSPKVDFSKFSHCVIFVTHSYSVYKDLKVDFGICIYRFPSNFLILCLCSNKFIAIFTIPNNFILPR